MPAPKHNVNAMRHGLRAAELPKDCRYIEHAMRTFRKRIEDMILDRHHGVNVYQAAVIQSTIRHERRAMLIERWMRLNDEMKIADKVSMMRELSAATDSRDKCLKSLGLDEISPQNILNIIPPIHAPSDAKNATNMKDGSELAPQTTSPDASSGSSNREAVE